jgi:hypothetical protein
LQVRHVAGDQGEEDIRKAVLRPAFNVPWRSKPVTV